MLNLLDSFGKQGASYGLISKVADVTDVTYLSKYFVISEFNPKFTAGRNSFALNGSTFLKGGTEIFVEAIDSTGDNLYIELARTIDSSAKIYAYKEATSFIFSIHVYNDTTDGIGQLIVYGTLIDGRSVKWTQNITIDKTLRNVSKVRFYTRPTLEVDAILVPVLSSTIAATLKQSIIFTGSCHGLAVNPPRDTNLPGVNRRNIDIDYRVVVDSPPIIGNITDDKSGVNSQMIGGTIDLIINSIQRPFSNQLISPLNQSASFTILDVVDNKTIKVSDPYSYLDSKNNTIVTNISNADFNVNYPYVSYNNATSSYQTTNLNGQVFIVQNSYADIIYKNIRTFTGFLARHKVYRKSLLSNADFNVMADEPLFINELLRDNLTQNKFYELMGKFYNNQHISHYWFTSSNNLQISHTPQFFIDSCQITSSAYNSLSGNDYIMVKNDSVPTNRDAVYVPFDAGQFSRTSGSAYDSNFMEFKKNVQYILQADVIVQKDDNVTDAAVEFYITSSIPDVQKDPNFTALYGIRLATFFADKPGIYNNFNRQVFFFTPKNDLFGTLVIVPKKCQPFLKNISLRVYGDDGFSPDVFISRIPWPISVANETYQIKSELFDINHQLVYSDLNVIQNFDSSGSSLVPFIPDGGSIVQAGTGDAFISGNLVVSKSIESLTGNVVIQMGSLYAPATQFRPFAEISSSRLITKLGHGVDSGKFAFTPIVDISDDDNYMYLRTGSSVIDTSVEANNPVHTRQSITSDYGRKIYWDNSGKHIETP
jgi:hypothetical protein